MLKIPFATWIANAAACLTGNYGDVTQQAQAADCSRQTVYDHAAKVQAAVEGEHHGGPTRACQWTRTVTRLVNPNSYEPEARSNGGFLHDHRAWMRLGSSQLPHRFATGPEADSLPNPHE
jgi:hypothetical protein